MIKIKAADLKSKEVCSNAEYGALVAYFYHCLTFCVMLAQVMRFLNVVAFRLVECSAFVYILLR